MTLQIKYMYNLWMTSKVESRLWNLYNFISSESIQWSVSPVMFNSQMPSLNSSQPRWLSGLMCSRVHSLWLLVDHCVLRNWDRILVRAVKGLISRAGMVSICPLLWQRDVKLQQTSLNSRSLPIVLNFSCKLGPMMNRYDFLEARRVIFSNVRTDSNFN